ncbi:MAG: ATP-dependent helicase [Actinobacteria bacterium]|nr:ATP-dependent helicase [Actinomycetota bacterium]
MPYSISVPDRSLDREPAVRAFRRLAEFALERTPEALLDVLRSSLIGLEDSEVRALERRARLEGVTLAELIARRPTGVPAGVAGRLAELLELSEILATHRDDDAEEAFWAVWRAASHYRALRENAGETSGGDVERELESLAVFARALGRFVERRRGSGTLGEYLESIGRADFGADPWLPPARRRGGVELLSFHASKGRQWSLVVVCGCVEGLIPKGRRARGLFDPYFLDRLSPVQRVLKNEAEDRRVFYVATTRARDRCVITTSPGASRRGQPTRFINELMGEAASPLPDAEPAPLTFSEAAARMRRALADVTAAAPLRLAALGALQRICKVDPECAAAQPRGWWWRWGWTEGAAAIRAQSGGEELPPDKLRTSYSRISKYDNCGLAYLFSVVLGLDPDSSHNMAFGSWIHQIFEDAEKEPSPEQRAGGRRRLTNGPMMAERFHELFEETVFPNLAIARQFRRDGLVLLERYEHHLKPGKALMSEHRFNVDFDGHLIRGRIDRVDKLGNRLIVYDYKTSRSAIYANEAKDSLQLAIYYLAATTDPDISQHGEPASMQLVYPAVMSRGDVARRCQKPEEAELVLERLPGLLQGVLDEDFRPSPEADCRWCKFKPLCPLWPEGRELPA